MYSTLTHSTHTNTKNTAFQTTLIEKESNNPLRHYTTVATATINRNVATTTTKATTATTTTTTTTFATTVTTTAKITEITQNSDLVHYYANKLKILMYKQNQTL